MGSKGRSVKGLMTKVMRALIILISFQFSQYTWGSTSHDQELWNFSDRTPFEIFKMNCLLRLPSRSSKKKDSLHPWSKLTFQELCANLWQGVCLLLQCMIWMTGSWAFLYNWLSPVEKILKSLVSLSQSYW